MIPCLNNATLTLLVAVVGWLDRGPPNEGFGSGGRRSGVGGRIWTDTGRCTQ